MIVNPTQTGWEVIYQQAHALLATKIAAHWRVDQRPERWIETLVALAQHDDESSDWTGNGHLTDSGAPLDFGLSKKTGLAQPSLVMYELQSKGQWGARHFDKAQWHHERDELINLVGLAGELEHKAVG